MSWVAVAIGGSAALSSGTSIMSGFMQKSAQDKALAGQLQMFSSAQAFTQQVMADNRNLFSSFIPVGQQALRALQGRVLSSSERRLSVERERLNIEADIKRLSVPTPFDETLSRVGPGPRESERRAALWGQLEGERRQRLAEAQSRLSAFDTERQALAPYEEQIAKEVEAREGRISGALGRLEKLATPTTLAELRKEVTESPEFQLRREELERSVRRGQTFRGSFLSGAALEEEARATTRLTGEELQLAQQRRESMANLNIAQLRGELEAEAPETQSLQFLAGAGLQAATAEAGASTAGAQNLAQIAGGQATAYGQASTNPLATGIRQAGQDVAGAATLFSLMNRPGATRNQNTGTPIAGKTSFTETF